LSTDFSEIIDETPIDKPAVNTEKPPEAKNTPVVAHNPILPEELTFDEIIGDAVYPVKVRIDKSSKPKPSAPVQKPAPQPKKNT